MGLAGIVVFLVITSFGRDGGAGLSAGNNRYVYVSIALLLPAAGLALSWLVQRRRGRLIAVIGLLVLVGIANFGQLLRLRDNFTGESLATEQQIMAAARIAAVEPVIPDSQPVANLEAPDLYLRVLEAWTRDGDLPTGVRPAPISVVDAATQIQLGLTTEPLFVAGGAVIVLRSSGLLVHNMADGCWSATSNSTRARFSLAVSSATAIWVDAHLGGSMFATLAVAGTEGAERRFLFARHERRWFDLAASPAMVSIAPPDGLTVASCWGHAGAAPSPAAFNPM
jgi:hypothetical protein